MMARLTSWNRMATALLAVACCGGCETIGSWMPKHDKVTEARENAAGRGTSLPMDVTPEEKLNVELAVAESLEGDNQPDQAAKIYLSAIKKNGNCTVAYQRLGLLYAKKGEWELSQKYFDVAIKKEPKRADLQCDLGYTYYLQHRDQEAEQRFRRALALEPDFSLAHNNLGILFARRNQNDAALREFCAGGCSEAQAHANLAMACAMENRLGEAREHYRIALAADPNLVLAKNGLAVLDNVDKKNLARGAAPGPVGPNPAIANPAEQGPAEARLTMPNVPLTY